MTDAAQFPIILTYHSISEDSSPIETPPALFRAQMEWVHRNARVVPLGELVTLLKEKKQFPSRAVGLTFDDGYRDFYEQAAPVLERWKLPAIVFLPTAFVGRTNCWPDAFSDEKPLMSWEQVKELTQKGIEFGSHSHTHADLTDLVEHEAPDEELNGSAFKIEERLGLVPKHFCYPYGRWNQKVREAVANVYESACSTGAGVLEPDADPFALPRVDAHYIRSERVLASMFTNRFLGYLTGRRWVRRLRGQPEGYYSRVQKD
jgi:peptidoglycan/xylan/chitin deacetylase (PgdA/CDA1 family)